MNDRDPDRTGAIREIAAILATAYLRLRFPEPPPPAAVIFAGLVCGGWVITRLVV